MTLNSDIFSGRHGFCTINPDYYSPADMRRDVQTCSGNRESKYDSNSNCTLMQYDGTTLRITHYKKSAPYCTIDISLTGDAIDGGRLPFLMVFNHSNWSYEPQCSNGSIAMGVEKSIDKATMCVVQTVATVTSVVDNRLAIMEGIDARGDKPEHRPIAVLPNATHVWALKNKLTEKIRKKMFASNYKHSACFAVVSARPSNIGFSFYDERNGKMIQEYAEPHGTANSRPERGYLGRTESWVKMGAGCLSAYVTKECFDFRRNDKNAYAEFHFNGKGLYGDHPLSGGGIVLGENSPAKGSYRRFYMADNYGGKHPLGEREVTITEFKRTYNSPEGLVFSPHSLNEYMWKGDEMTPIERDEVKKWFATHVATLARKGTTLSEESLEIAKNLGIYTGK